MGVNADRGARSRPGLKKVALRSGTLRSKRFAAFARKYHHCSRNSDQITVRGNIALALRKPKEKAALETSARGKGKEPGVLRPKLHQSSFEGAFRCSDARQACGATFSADP